MEEVKGSTTTIRFWIVWNCIIKTAKFGTFLHSIWIFWWAVSILWFNWTFSVVKARSKDLVWQRMSYTLPGIMNSRFSLLLVISWTCGLTRRRSVLLLIRHLRLTLDKMYLYQILRIMNDWMMFKGLLWSLIFCMGSLGYDLLMRADSVWFLKVFLKVLIVLHKCFNLI